MLFLAAGTGAQAGKSEKVECTCKLDLMRAKILANNVLKQQVFSSTTESDIQIVTVKDC